MDPYAVVLATGGTPLRPRSIPGIAMDHVYTAPQILTGKVQLTGKKVAVIGSGLTGLETTEALNESGNDVTVVEMAKTVAPGAWFQFVDDSMSRIKPFGTTFLLNTALCAIKRRNAAPFCRRLPLCWQWACARTTRWKKR